MKKVFAFATAFALLGAGVAHAGGVSWSVGIGTPFVGTVISGGPQYRAPAYAPVRAYGPPPIAYAPVRVYAPAPVYVPAPVYAPVPVYAPAPVVYRPVRPYYRPRVFLPPLPVVFHGHGHPHGPVYGDGHRHGY